MYTNSYVAAELDRARQRDMHAHARRQHPGRQTPAQSGTAKSVERPMRRVRRALRAVFA
jgi:hypothetical protein